MDTVAKGIEALIECMETFASSVVDADMALDNTTEALEINSTVSAKRPNYLDNTLGYSKLDQKACTPPAVYRHLDAEFHFDFDPCPSDPQFDGFKVDWGMVNYVNPPYSDLSSWLSRALVQRDERGATSVFLIPFRPHTKYFRELVSPNANEIRFFRKKFAFLGYDRASLAVVVIVFRPNVKPPELTSMYDRRFNILHLTEKGGPRTMQHLARVLDERYSFDHIIHDADVTCIDGQSSILVVTNLTPQAFIERAQSMFEKTGNTICIVIPFRIESSYCLNKIIFGTATHVLALAPTVCTKGFTAPSPTGSVVLVWTKDADESLYRTSGFKFSVIDTDFQKLLNKS